MPEDKTKSELKSEIAQQKVRDGKGHFIHVEPPQNSQQPQPSNNPIARFLSENTHYSKNQDDLLDVHVGNPLHKITTLLEDIKKQKAFSFTLKGSLGIMGVFLALSVFGVFGGGQILCDKGEQTQIGTLKELQVKDTSVATIPVLSSLLNVFEQKQIHNRTVLIKNDQTVIKIPYTKNIDIVKYKNYQIMATGAYDSCSQSLKITDTNAIEFYTGVK